MQEPKRSLLMAAFVTTIVAAAASVSGDNGIGLHLQSLAGNQTGENQAHGSTGLEQPECRTGLADEALSAWTDTTRPGH